MDTAEHPYAVVDRTEAPICTCSFITSASIEEAIAMHFENLREVHVMDGDKLRTFVVKVGAIDIKPASWSK
jgi:hypothetical protein